jgi:RNA polymerase sigma factor for flagellar operon FliA
LDEQAAEPAGDATEESGANTAVSQAARARANQAYTAQSRQSQEEAWILGHLPLVRHIVAKIASHAASKADFEDLVSAGTLGLVKAARSFDPHRDAEFKTYAYIRVRGAVLDELRKKSFVPTGQIHQIRNVQRIYQQYVAEHGNTPTDEDLAERADLSVEQLYKVLEEARKQNFLSIHGLAGDEDDERTHSLVPPDAAPSPDDQVVRKEMLERMSQAIQSLGERDRIVLILYYERDLTMKEAAQVLGVTESRVSQLHAAALFKLSMKLRN